MEKRRFKKINAELDVIDERFFPLPAGYMLDMGNGM